MKEKSGFELIKTDALLLALVIASQIASFLGPAWGPAGFSRSQIGPMLAPWTLLSGKQRSDVNEEETEATGG